MSLKAKEVFEAHVGLSLSLLVPWLAYIVAATRLEGRQQLFGEARGGHWLWWGMKWGGDTFCGVVSSQSRNLCGALSLVLHVSVQSHYIL